MNERIREIAEQAIKDVDVVHEDNPFNIGLIFGMFIVAMRIS